MINILCPSPKMFSEKGLEYAAEFGRLYAMEMSQEEFEQAAPEFNILLVRFNTRVNSTAMNPRIGTSQVHAVLSPTTGIDHLDISAICNAGAQVFHLKGEREFLTSITGTAELALGLLLSISRKIVSSVNSVNSGIWMPDQYRGIQLHGRTMGIIGIGRLGSMMARYGEALGMSVIAYDPYVEKLPDYVRPACDLEDLLIQSDVVTLHAPLNEETKHMLAENEFRQMRKTAILINTSRGALVNSIDLQRALEEGVIAGAALDVIEDELLFPDVSNPLTEYAKNHENCIITSHIGGATFDSVEKTDLYILEKYFNGQNSTLRGG